MAFMRSRHKSTLGPYEPYFDWVNVTVASASLFAGAVPLPSKIVPVNVPVVTIPPDTVPLPDPVKRGPLAVSVFLRSWGPGGQRGAVGLPRQWEKRVRS